LGHEFSGRVVEVGEEVTKVQVGDRVVVEQIYACGKCSACKKGIYNLCVKMGFYCLAGGDGFSEYAAIPEAMLHNIPETIPYEQEALVEPSASILVNTILKKVSMLY
jgi:(R,R)-butanediol dehydrogenase / meso-butanediol dehydrogenase / diacetyl reductase